MIDRPSTTVFRAMQQGLERPLSTEADVKGMGVLPFPWGIAICNGNPAWPAPLSIAGGWTILYNEKLHGGQMLNEDRQPVFL